MENIEEIKEYAVKNSVPIMKDEGIEFICSLIKERNAREILEIGSAIGYSAIRFASLAQDIHVTTVEIDIDRYIRAVQNIQDHGLSERIEIHNMDALDFSTDKKFDLVFIDAAKAQYTRFFEKFSENLKPEGVIISDNLFFHGMVDDLSLTHNYSTIKLVRKIRKYVSYLKSNPEFKTTFYDKGDGVSSSCRIKNFIPAIFNQVRESDNPAIARQIEYGHSIWDMTVANADPSNPDVPQKAGRFSFYKKENWLVINDFHVEREFRARNFSRQMIFFIRKQAEKLGIHLLKMTVPSGTENSAALERIGFSKVSEDLKNTYYEYRM